MVRDLFKRGLDGCVGRAYCSLVRKIIALATSSVDAMRLSGILLEALFLNDAYSDSLIPVYLYMFVSMVEGETQFTLIP
jgi:hypothetical protein